MFNEHNKAIEKPTIILSRYVALTMAILTISFGSSVIIGWHGHIEGLIRYKSGTSAMVYNSALTFVLMGVGILAVIYQLRKLFIAICIIVVILGSFALAQHLFNINLGIDQLLFYHYDSIGNLYPGRMAPNTGFCFVLSGISLLLIGYGKYKKNYIIIGGYLGFFILTLSIVFISGYMNNLQNAYEWGEIKPMSINSAIGFMFLAVNLMFLAWHAGVSQGADMFKYLSFIVALSLFIATCMLTAEIGELEHANNYSSDIPIVTFIIGTILSLAFGILLHFIYVAQTTAKIAKRSLSLMNATLESTADGILVVDLDGEIVAYNHQFIQMLGLEQSKMSTYNRQSLTAAVLDKLSNKEKYFVSRKNLVLHPTESVMDQLRLKNGTIIERFIKPQFLDDKVVGRVCSYRDITMQKRLETQLLHQSTYDNLTQLPNRALLLDMMNRAISAAKNDNKIVGIFLLDIDNFSQMNDIFGRSKGDQLLKEIVHRLKSTLPAECILGRIGGDELLVIDSNLNSQEKSLQIINKLMSALSKPFDLYGHEVRITMCIGAALYPKDGYDTDTLLGNADIALLRAKKDGRNEFQFYSQDMNNYTIKHIELETQLQKALSADQFIIYYQPIYNLNDNKPIGAEALVRWRHPQHGILEPLEFIPLAEEIGVIQQIGEFVLTTSCQEAKKWHDAGFKDLTIAVNISAHQFKYGLLINSVQKALQLSGLDPHKLELELTETVLIGGTEEVSNTLKELHKLGVKISIDDFGTGYSSFSYVKRFPIYKLKIDKMFIADAIKNKQDKAIIIAMIVMGKSLGFKVLAEGIETTEQLEFLQAMGCEQGQGFLFSLPLPAKDCISFFQKTFNF